MNQPLSQQAVFVCKSESFRRWIDRQKHWLDGTTDVRGAAEYLKSELSIQSRNELDTNPEAACAFEKILSLYRRNIAEWGMPS